MMLKELIQKNRSTRRFDQSQSIQREVLEGLVDLARRGASAANLQPLKYILSCEPGRNGLIFKHLSWAGYLSDWPGPGDGQRPVGYILILGDTRICKNFGCDHGIAGQSILLGATEMGLGGCMVGSIDRQGLRAALAVPSYLEILLAVALGRPAEKVVLEEMTEGGDIKYYRDSQGVHHVPKRSLKDVILD